MDNTNHGVDSNIQIDGRSLCILCSLAAKRQVFVPAVELAHHLERDHQVRFPERYKIVVDRLGRTVSEVLAESQPPSTQEVEDPSDDVLQRLESLEASLGAGAVSSEKHLSEIGDDLDSLIRAQAVHRTLLLGVVGNVLSAFILWIARGDDRARTSSGPESERTRAAKALSPREISRWLRTIDCPAPIQLLEDTYAISASLTPELIAVMESRLRRLAYSNAERAQSLAGVVNLALKRHRDADLAKVYALGTSTVVTVAPGDTAGLQGEVKGWARRPRLRINLRGNNGLTIDLAARVESIRSAMTVEPSVQLCAVNVGEFERHTMDEGEIHLEWSNLIENEGVTFVLMRDSTVVSALVVLNPNCALGDVAAQELLHALGFLQHVGPGESPEILRDPLPRPRSFFNSPSYEHFLHRWVQLEPNKRGVRDTGTT